MIGWGDLLMRAADEEEACVPREPDIYTAAEREEWASSPCWRRCYQCDGAGYSLGAWCRACHGRGYFRVVCEECHLPRHEEDAGIDDGGIWWHQACWDAEDTGPLNLAVTQPMPAITMAELVAEPSEGERCAWELIRAWKESRP